MYNNIEKTQEIQDRAKNYPPIIRRKVDAAEFLGISLTALNDWERSGFMLMDVVKGYTTGVYFRDRLTNVYEEFQKFKKQNPDLYEEFTS